MTFTLIPYRISGCCLVSLALILTNGPPGFSQVAPPQHSFPTQSNPQINISNASTISITSWDKNEVTVTAEVSGTSMQTDEVKIMPDKKKLGISCHPATPDRKIFLTLRVPAKSVLQIMSERNEIQIKEPVGQTTIITSRDLIQLNVPETASLDMQYAPKAVEHRFPQRGGFSQTGIGSRVQGSGQPYVKVIAKTAEVIVGRGLISPVTSTTRFNIPPATPARPVVRPPTLAATTIARRTSSMSRALRKSNPQLIRPSSRLDQSVPQKPADSEAEAVRLETYLVNLNVGAIDRAGRAIPGLTKADFKVYEDGVLQPISFFAPQESPFNLVLLLDLSGSVRDKIDLIRNTALQFIDVIRPQDSIAVITFTTDVTVVSHLTKDRDDLRESLEYILTPPSGTAFYDALGYVLVEEFRKVKGQRNAVIAITDGEDNALQSRLQKTAGNAGLRSNWQGSFLTFEELLDGVTEADALIYPIHVDPTAPQPINNAVVPSAMLRVQSELTALARKQLESLADASGGRLYHADRIEDLKGVFEHVAAELRTVYSIGYTPTNLNFDGRFRKLLVQVNKPDVVVRTRPGYYGR
ncbi:MAG TPA: VWA domain-containing protein [Blastocatellia bacterium]|nr:VWA domain-containing protein [Blastocatellia bacterium]